MRKLLTFICTLLVAIGASATINRNLHASVVLEKKTTTENELNLSTVGIRQAIIGEVEMADEPTMEEWNAKYVAKQQKAAAAEYAAHDYYFVEGMMHWGLTPTFKGVAVDLIAIPFMDSVVWKNLYGPTDWYDQYNDSLLAEDSETWVAKGRYGIDGVGYYLPYTTDHTVTQGDTTLNIKGYKFAAGNANGGLLASGAAPYTISTGENIPITLCGMATDPMNNENGSDFYRISANSLDCPYAYGTNLYTDVEHTLRIDTIISTVRNVSPLTISSINIPVFNVNGTAIMPEGGQVKIELFAADLTEGNIYTDSVLATTVATVENFVEVQAGVGTIVATFQEEDPFGGMMDVSVVVKGDFVVQLTGFNESGCDFGIYADYYNPGGTTMYKVGGKYTPIFSKSSNLAIMYDAYWPTVQDVKGNVMNVSVEGGEAYYVEEGSKYNILFTNVYDVDALWSVDYPEWMEVEYFLANVGSEEEPEYVVAVAVTVEPLTEGTGRQGIVTFNADGYVYELIVNQGDVSNPAQTTITYELNGGVTNDDNWLSKGDMWTAFCADAGITLGTLEEVKALGDPYTAICTPLATANAQAILDNAKWDWLEAYIMTVQNADAGATALVEGTSGAGWRYALAAFFVEGKRASWPVSADFAVAGTPEAFIPAWKHAFANPTEPTAEWVLNAPYKEGATFDGWYAAADFSGEKVVKIDATTTGTLYAKWVEYIPTVVEVRALADDTETKVSGVVNFISGKNLYIQDATAGILVYTTETPNCKVGDKIVAKGVKVMYGGAPEVKSAVIESAEAASVTAPTVFETLTPLVADSLEHKYFATNVTIAGVTIVEYDSYNNPTVQDATGVKALCYKMVLDPVAFPIGSKVTVTAVAGWYKGFQFVGDAKNIVITVAGVKENYTYPVRDSKYTLENNWVISNIEGNFAYNKPGSNNYVRGMAAKDGIMYFINRETESLVRVDGETGKMLDPIKLQGTDTLFKSATVDSVGNKVWAAGTTFPYNDIKFDQEGHCLIGACLTGASKCQTFYIYVVDLATGVCTKLIEDVLWENPGLDQVQFRFDAFGVAGDVTKNGVIMAADANGSWNVYRWLITDGVAGEGEQVAVLLDPAVDESLFIKAAGYGTAPQIFPQDEEGSLFYVDGFNTLPMLFYGSPEEGATLIDDFINVPTGVKVWNNDGDTIAMNANFNGLVEFQVGEEYFLLMVATNNTHSLPTSYALFKFADADCAFAGMEPLWYFPHNGLGTATIGCRTAVPSVDVIDDNTAILYLYATNNGYASYTLKIDSKQDITTSVEDFSIVNNSVEKLLRNGQLLILRDGKTYNAMGAEIR